MSSNHPGTGHPESQNDAANKRAALAGQWRTPPMPVYPTTGYAQAPGIAPAHHAPAATQGDNSMPSISAPTSIPSNSDEYAKALQEAYRKGAEAAARMAHQQHNQIPNAASCPNFTSGPNGAPPPGEAIEEAAYAHQVHPTTTSHSTPDPLASSSMPPPPPQHPTPHYSQPPSVHHHVPPQQQQQQQQQQHHYAPPLPAEYSHPPPQPAAPANDNNNHKSGTQVRSLSMPDMSTYAAQAEEEKRQKRLARNRASARLRRLRKKNLVDAYETEVGILEKTLKQLRAHEWGRDDNHKALLDALGMERGQQAIPPEQRATIIRDILNHQMQQVQLLRQAQLEQECLAMMVMDENDEMAQELQSILQLSDAQKEELRTCSQGLDKEVEALETISSSLQAMQENDWLLNEGIAQITDQFTSILHKNQLSKFLLWTDANVEAIDQLDHVQVQPLQGAPLFTFGVETTPVDDDEAKS